ncbi:MAG: Trk system potassium transporter TrkA [Planctomycetota bacterium]
MNIVINGGGGVGRAVAHALSSERHDVTVIEPSAAQGRTVEEVVDCHVVTGNGALPPVLRQAGVGDADIFVAVTDRDEVNLLSCLIARRLGCPRAIARVRDRAFTVADRAVPMDDLGIEQVINPDAEASREIIRLLRNPGTTEVFPLAGGAAVIAGMPVAEGSALCGPTLAELQQMHTHLLYRVAVIRRQDQVSVPTGQDHIEPGDQIFVIAEPETVEKIGRMAGAIGQQPIDRAMVLGANDLGQSVASLLQGTCRVTLVGGGQEDLTQASEELTQTLVIQSQDHDLDLLEREGLAQMDAFVAVTDDEEMNLITCLSAKRMGVPRTIARVERPFYRPLIEGLGVDAAVSARQATVNAILKYLRTGHIHSVAQMRGVPAEALDFEADRGAKILDRPLREIRFPRGAMAGMVVRPEGVIVPTGDTCIRQGDHVIVFALHGAVRKVQKLFS